MLLRPVNASQFAFRAQGKQLNYHLLDQQNKPLMRQDSQHLGLMARGNSTPLYALIENGIFSPPGRYTSVIAVKNADGLQQSSHIHFDIPPIALLGMEGESIKAITNRNTHYTVDMGDIYPGKQHTIPLVVRANTPVQVEVKSQNKGLKHNKGALINYQLTMNRKQFSPKQPHKLVVNTHKQGQPTKLPMKITILDGATAPAGEYTDQLSITVNAR
ncbi:hypothetical protein ACPV51_08690 [Vibrio astriarenae]